MRPIGPFPRPPLQQQQQQQPPRFSGAFPQRPPSQFRPTFNAQQKLDSTDTESASKYENYGEEQRTTMKNRSYSVTEEQPNRGLEERRYSISSTGSIDGGNRFYPSQGRPDSRLLSTAEGEVEKPVKNERNGEQTVRDHQITSSLNNAVGQPSPDVQQHTKPAVAPRKSDETEKKPASCLNEEKSSSLAEAKAQNDTVKSIINEENGVVEKTQSPTKKITSEELKESEKKSINTLDNDVEKKLQSSAKQATNDDGSRELKKNENMNVEDKSKSEEQKSKKESSVSSKGRNTPDLKIPLKKSALRKG